MYREGRRREHDRGGAAGLAITHAEPGAPAAARERRAYRRGAEGIRLRRRGNRGAAPRTRHLIPPRPRCERTEPDMTKTDKMIARTEGGVGYLVFNNPERHNAVSFEMWQAAGEILD